MRAELNRSGAASIGTPATFDLIGFAPATLILVIAVAAADTFGSGDLWWHIPEGRMILATGHLPAKDFFSFTAAGKPWRSHEWLAQVVLALAWDWLAAYGLRLVKVVCAAVLIIAMAIAMRETRIGPRVQVIVMLLAAAGIEPMMELRPHMFTYALMAVLLAILACDNSRHGAAIWLVVPLFALWANLHGGFAVGLAVLAAYAGAVTIGQLPESRGRAHTLHLWAATIGAILATLINPQGIGLWRTIWFVLRDPGARVALIEWLPLIPAMRIQWHTSFDAGFVYVIPLMLFAAYAIVTLAAWDREALALDATAVLLIAAAFDATRNMALGVIGLATPLARHVDSMLHRRGWMMTPDLSATIPGPVALALAGLILLSGGFFSPRLRAAYECPAGAVSFIQNHDLAGNILCELDWGQYLIWHLGPRSKVFIDGRTHLVYPLPVLNDYLQFNAGLVSGDALAQRYPIDFVLIRPSAAGYRALAASPRWRIIYRDQVGLLFARSESAVALAFPSTVVGEAPPTYFP